MSMDYETDLCPTPKVKAIEHIFTKRTLGLPGDTGCHVVALLCVHACSTPTGWGRARPTNRHTSTAPFALHALTSNTCQRMEDIWEEKKGAQQKAGDKMVVSAQPQSMWSLSHYTDISSLTQWTV